MRAIVESDEFYVEILTLSSVPLLCSYSIVVTKVEQELAAAAVLKRAFRSFIRRMYGRAYRAAVRARSLLRNS